MKRTTKMAVGVAVVVLMVFFFVAPVVWTNIIPCVNGGYGFSSLSYRLLHIGETFINGQFSWNTQAYSNCNATETARPFS